MANDDAPLSPAEKAEDCYRSWKLAISKKRQERMREILETEFSEEFVQGMRDRMLISFHKYGPVANAYPSRVDAIGSLMQRLRLYAEGDPSKGVEPGNTEYLMDAANFAMIEFMYPRHPDAHFKPTDDDASPGRIATRTGKADKRDNLEIGTGQHRSSLAAFR